MIHHKTFIVNPVEENCYVLWDDTSHEGAIVDCGMWNDREQTAIAQFINAEGIEIKYLLQTHMHFDHCMGLGFAAEQYGLMPLCHAADLPVYKAAPEMVLRWFRKDITDMLPEVRAILTEASSLSLGDTTIQILHTPGHTPGGICYYVSAARLVFTGDTLFRQGIGRSDLPGGNLEQELESIREKLFTLPPDTTALPGHGPATTIGEEQDSNPYLV